MLQDGTKYQGAHCMLKYSKSSDLSNARENFKKPRKKKPLKNLLIKKKLIDGYVGSDYPLSIITIH